MISSIKRTFRSYNGRHFASRWVRFLLEKRDIKKLLAYQFTTAFALFSLFEPATQAYLSGKAIAQIPSNEIVIEEEITTETTLSWSVKSPRITQTYRFGHSGIDIQDTNGNRNVYPIDKGWVSKVSRSLFGYGNHVFVRHPNNRASLYAHLATVEVEEGQEVTRDTVLGKMGKTGRASGIHLHLEIYQNGRAIDPLTILPEINKLPILDLTETEEIVPDLSITTMPTPTI